MCDIPSTSKQTVQVQDDDIFEDSEFLANFDSSSFRETTSRFSESNINDSANRSGLNVSALCCDEEISGYDKLTGRTWIYPTNYPVRDYQFNIIKAAILKNTLVSLPTGLGKTFIAAVIMYNFYRWYPLGKIIFVAPTRPLVAQQINACYDIIGIPPADTVEMTGHMSAAARKTHWQSKRVFFATPQVIYNDIKSDICPAAKIRCLVIDEAHRARGNYAYCQIMGSLTDMGHKTYRVLALSATPGSRVEDVVNVVKNLHIAHLELRTENCIDVAPYSHARHINTVIVPLGSDLTMLRQHYVEIMDDYARRLKQLNILPHNLGNMSKGRVVMLYKKYQTTERSARHPQHNHMMRDFTLLIALFHGLELLVKHGSRVFLNFFDEHPEKSWIQADDRLTALLERLRDDLGVNPMTLNTSILPDGTVPEIPTNLCFGHPKFDKLKEIMLEHFTKAKEKKQDTKAIVFCEYRDSVNLVHCLLLQYRPLIAPQKFTGQGSSGKDGIPAISQKEQLRVMKSFREGVSNTLVATSVAEEGLDVGSVDLIVCFDISTRSPIRLVQRCGRTGRERGGKVHILVTEGREHQTLLECMRQRDGLNKKILNSRDVQAALYTSNPRLIPRDFTPQCQKMHITVTKKPASNDAKDKEKKNQKNLRTMLLGRGSASSSSSSNNKDLESCIISEQEFQQIFPDGLPSQPLRAPLELWAMSKESILKLSKSEEPRITMHTTWLEWQRTLQSTVNIGHSKDTEILASVLQYSDAKRFDMPPSTQNPSFSTQDFASQKYVPTLKTASSPAKISSPAKAKPTKKKQKLPLIKSPGKKDGDIRALFSTATKSTKNYTKLITELGIQNDGSIPTKLINLLVDLSLANTNYTKKCYICENVCDCTFLQDLRRYKKKPAGFLSVLGDVKFPEIELIDEIDAESILKCAVTEDSQMFDGPSIEDRNFTRLSADNKKVSNNFELEFDFGSPIDLASPENNTEDEVKPAKEMNFDIGDIEDVFVDSSPEEVVETEVKTEKKEALGFFGLDSIDDIFADSDDDLDAIQNVQSPYRQLKKQNDAQHKELQLNTTADKCKEIRVSGIPNNIDKPNETNTQPLSPSLLSGNTRTCISPILCTQVRKFELSAKKKPQSSTPQTPSNARRQLKPDLRANSNITPIKKDTSKSIQTNMSNTTNKSLFTITQLVDMINKTDPSISKDVTILDDERCTSPILLTQADRKKVLNDSKNNSMNNFPVKQNSRENKSNISSLIILASDDSDSDNDHTQIYDVVDNFEVGFKENIIETPKKLDASKTSLKIDDLDDVPNVLTPGQSPVTNKRKLDSDEEVPTASPYFNKKPKIETDTKKKVSLQEKILAALNKKTDKFNNDINVNFMMSPKKPLFEKENKNPNNCEENDTKFTDEKEYVRRKNLEMLQRFRRDTKVLSPKNGLTSISETSRPQMTNKRKLTFGDSDDDFDDPYSHRNQRSDSCTKSNKNHKVRKKRKPNEFLDLEAALSDDGSASGDELSDDSVGSLAEFICDESLTQRDDMRAVYIRSVKIQRKSVLPATNTRFLPCYIDSSLTFNPDKAKKHNVQLQNFSYLTDQRWSPVKGVFKIPELPNKYNKEEILSQFVPEDSYEMDSFCVDSHIGLTQVNDYSDLEIAEMLLEKRKCKIPKKNKAQPNSADRNGDSPVVRKKRIVKRIQSDSDDSS